MANPIYLVKISELIMNLTSLWTLEQLQKQ